MQLGRTLPCAACLLCLPFMGFYQTSNEAQRVSFTLSNPSLKARSIDIRHFDPELTLSELARRLQTNPSMLSAAINRAFGKKPKSVFVVRFQKQPSCSTNQRLTFSSISCPSPLCW